MSTFIELLGPPQISQDAQVTDHTEWSGTLKWQNPDRSLEVMLMFPLECPPGHMVRLGIFPTDGDGSADHPLPSDTVVELCRHRLTHYQQGAFWLPIETLVQLLEAIEVDEEDFGTYPELRVNGEVWPDKLSRFA